MGLIGKKVPEVQLQPVKQVVSWLLITTLGNPSAAHTHLHLPPLDPPTATEKAYAVSLSNTIKDYQSWFIIIHDTHMHSHA